jgi:predicted DNA-binding transcriptional regulator AlpA
VSGLPVHLLRLDDVLKATGLSRMTIEREMAAGRFPRAVYPTQATRAWRSDEIAAWIDALPREPNASKAA